MGAIYYACGQTSKFFRSQGSSQWIFNIEQLRTTKRQPCRFQSFYQNNLLIQFVIYFTSFYSVIDIIYKILICQCRTFKPTQFQDNNSLISSILFCRGIVGGVWGLKWLICNSVGKYLTKEDEGMYYRVDFGLDKGKLAGLWISEVKKGKKGVRYLYFNDCFFKTK